MGERGRSGREREEWEGGKKEWEGEGGVGGRERSGREREEWEGRVRRRRYKLCT